MASKRGKDKKQRRKARQQKQRSRRQQRATPQGPGLRERARYLIGIVIALLEAAEEQAGDRELVTDEINLDMLLEIREVLDQLPAEALEPVVDALQEMVDTAEGQGWLEDGEVTLTEDDGCDGCPWRGTPQCEAHCDDAGGDPWDEPQHPTAQPGRLDLQGSHRQRAGCHHPIHTDLHGRPQPDPWRELGLEPPAGLIDPQRVREAWRRLTIEHPPEVDPERTRRIREARDRLTEPSQVIARELALLHVPDPDQLGLPEIQARSTSGGLLPARDRLAGQLVLYALLEDRLHAPDPAPPAPTRGGGDKPDHSPQMNLPF